MVYNWWIESCQLHVLYGLESLYRVWFYYRMRVIAGGYWHAVGFGVESASLANLFLRHRYQRPSLNASVHQCRFSAKAGRSVSSMDRVIRALWSLLHIYLDKWNNKLYMAYTTKINQYYMGGAPINGLEVNLSLNIAVEGFRPSASVRRLSPPVRAI